MTPQMLLQLLPIAMTFIQAATDPSTPTGQLAQEIRQLLFQHQTQLAQMAAMHPQMMRTYGATPPPQPPPLDHLKTPEDLLHFIKSQPTPGAAPA
jgi:hypothetical protein